MMSHADKASVRAAGGGWRGKREYLQENRRKREHSRFLKNLFTYQVRITVL